jgi:hypothetical protein
MHHPQIYDIIATIEDFFLLTESEYKCLIEPCLYFKTQNPDDEEPKFSNFRGLKISRKLNNGKLEVNIFGFFDDNDSMDLKYFSHDDSNNPKKIIEFVNNYSKGFNVEATRLAIREIIALDRELASELLLPVIHSQNHSS